MFYCSKTRAQSFRNMTQNPLLIKYNHTFLAFSSWLAYRLVVGDTLVFYLNEYFIELNQAKLKILNKFLNWIFWEKILLNNFLNWIFLKKMILNNPLKWMNESYFESIFAIFDEKSPFLSILDTFWTIFGHFSYSTSIKESLTIELNYLLNWISKFFWIE